MHPPPPVPVTARLWQGWWCPARSWHRHGRTLGTLRCACCPAPSGREVLSGRDAEQLGSTPGSGRSRQWRSCTPCRPRTAQRVDQQGSIEKDFSYCTLLFHSGTAVLSREEGRWPKCSLQAIELAHHILLVPQLINLKQGCMQSGQCLQWSPVSHRMGSSFGGV